MLPDESGSLAAALSALGRGVPAFLPPEMLVEHRVQVRVCFDSGSRIGMRRGYVGGMAFCARGQYWAYVGKRGSMHLSVEASKGPEA